MRDELMTLARNVRKDAGLSPKDLRHWYAEKIEALATQQPEAGEAVDGDYILPCDVKVWPATTITKGCKLSTLIHCIQVRDTCYDLEVDGEGLTNAIAQFRGDAAPKAEAQGAVNADLYCIEGEEIQACDLATLLADAVDCGYCEAGESVPVQAWKIVESFDAIALSAQRAEAT